MNKIFKFRFLGIAAFLAMIAVFSAAAMLLWNALMPEIFGLPVLNYWQTAGMVILTRILFGGLGGIGRAGALGGLRGGDDRLFAHGNALREKWLNMTDDERKEFMCSQGRFSHFHEFFNGQSDRSGKDPSGSGTNEVGGGAKRE